MNYSNKKSKNLLPASKGGESKPVEIVFNNYYAHIEPVFAKPLEVKVVDNFDRAFKAFRAIVQKEKVISNFKQKQTYEKPSDRKRRKRSERARKLKELEFKEKNFETD
jgi:small subunit ribosomal protein S21